MRRLLSLIEKILFPKFCLGCARYGKFVCRVCLTKTRPVRVTICPYCSKRTLDGFTHPLCGNHDTRIDGLRSVFYYQGVMTKILSSLKYRSATIMREAIQDLLATVDPDELGRYLGDSSVLVPVPLHENRLLERGFNQASLIAQEFASITGTPLAQGMVKRIKNTPPQAKTKSKTDRILNMQGAFALSKQLLEQYREKTLVIVDDVYTSGTTTKEMTRALKGAGCKRVLVLTLCH